MIYYTEELHNNYLIPKIKAFYCDVCGEAVTDQKSMSEFSELITEEGKIMDICPRCQKMPLPKNFGVN